jgi:hypothetical protein
MKATWIRGVSRAVKRARGTRAYAEPAYRAPSGLIAGFERMNVRSRHVGACRAPARTFAESLWLNGPDRIGRIVGGDEAALVAAGQAPARLEDVSRVPLNGGRWGGVT